MQTLSRVLAVVAIVATFAIITTFIFASSPGGPQPQEDMDEEHVQIHKAIKDLRYADALRMLEKLQKEGKATTADRMLILEMLEKLRRDEELPERLEAMLSGAEPFERGLLLEWKIKQLVEDGTWRHRDEIKKIYREANSLLKQHASSPEQKRLAREFILRELAFLNQRTTDVSITMYNNLLQIFSSKDPSGEELAKARYLRAEGFERALGRGSDDYSKIVEAFRLVISQHADTEWAPKAQLEIVRLYGNRQDFVSALAEAETLMQRWPSSSEAEMAARVKEEITTPRLRTIVERVWFPEDQPDVKLRYRNIENISFKLYNIDLISQFLEHRHLETFLDEVDIDELTAAATFTHEDSGSKDYHWRNASVDVPVESSGAYLLVASGGGVGSRTLVIVSALAEVVKFVDDDVFVYTAGAGDGRPTSGAEVLLAFGEEEEYTRTIDGRQRRLERIVYNETYTGSTGEDGTWRQQVVTSAKNGRRPLLAISRSGDDYALSQEAWWWWRSGGSDETWHIYGYTDRPVYRPGQEVFFKALVRTEKGDDLTYQTGSDVAIEIRDAQGAKIETLTDSLDAFGTVSGSFMLPEDAALGTWYARITSAAHNATISFRVEEYKKPEYRVTVSPDQTQFRLGSSFSADVSAAYYFGEPVAGGTIEYTVRQQHIGWWYRPAGDYDWFYGSSRPSRYYGGGRVVDRGSVKADADGNATIRVKTTALDNDRRDEKVYSYTLEVRVVDESRRAVESSTSAVVTSHEFGVDVSSGKWSYTPGENARLKLTTRRYDGTPVATTGSVVLYRATWNSNEREYDLERIKAADAATDAEGSGELTIALEDEGHFIARYETADAYDNTVHGQTSIYVASRAVRTAFFPSDGLEILPDKQQYQAGETARLLVQSTWEGWGLLTVEAERILSHRIVRLQPGMTPVEMPVTKTHQPNVFVKITGFNGYALYQTTKELQVPPVEKFANITITPSKQAYQPGEKGTFIVEATDYQGNPLRAQFSIGVVDSAIYYFGEDDSGDIRKALYGHMHSDSVRMANSFEFRFYGSEYAEEEADMAMAGDAAPVQRMEQRAMKTTQSLDREGGGGNNLADVPVRSDFKDTALWIADVTTGADGRAEVTMDWPDNLTDWRVTVRAVTADTIVGSTTENVVTRKDLLLRLQTPRFLVERDEVTLSANVHNYSDSEMQVEVGFRAEGLRLLDEGRTITIAAGGQQRVDVRARAEVSGVASITAAAAAVDGSLSDAMKLDIPVLVHGIEKFTGGAGSLEASGTAELSLTLPETFKAGSQTLTLSLSPTPLNVVFKSLPYLIDYPYGCVEQTMSRFLPAAMAYKVAIEFWEADNSLGGKIEEVTKAGIKRLADFQHSDGGWGWWKGGTSSPYMSAYVVYGLTVAKELGIDMPSGMLERGRKYLLTTLDALAGSDEVETLNFVVFALSHGGSVEEKYLNRIEDLLSRMKEYETSLFAVALHNLEQTPRFQNVIERLKGLAKVNEQYGTATWGDDGGWYWYQDNVEATAWALMALNRADGTSDLSRGALRWLLSKRKGGHWKSTRDTAIAIYAIVDYVQRTGSSAPDMNVSVRLNGVEVSMLQLSRANLFDDDTQITLPAGQLQAGEQKLEFVVDGQGTLFYDGLLTWFSTEEPITAASTTIAVERTYWRVQKGTGGPGEAETFVPLKDGEQLTSGEEIEVRLKLTSENIYEYLVYEDYKPAGCEAVARTSGRNWSGVGSHMELRDEKVAFFIDTLPRGEHTIRYRLRAEAPGTFHALPTNGYAMYSPDIRAISDERITTIRE